MIVFKYFLLMCLNLKCHKSVSFLNLTSPKLSLFENNFLAIFKSDSKFSQTSWILKKWNC